MTPEGPYREALPHEIAVMVRRDWAGAQFEPTLARTFIEALDGGSANAAAPASTPAALQPQPVIPQGPCSYS